MKTSQSYWIRAAPTQRRLMPHQTLYETDLKLSLQYK